jgi:hAT family C-terminal dimerisation region
MAKSLLRWKEMVIKVVSDPSFENSARASRSERRTEEDEQLEVMERLLEEGIEADLQPLDIPSALAGNKRFCRAWQATLSDLFWNQLRQYVQLNEIVATAITCLGGTTATLSDAALRMLQLNSHFLALPERDYSELLPSGDMTILRAVWQRRFQDHLRPHHHLALLLDPRQHVRHFVKGSKDILGSKEEGTVGNTEFIRSADSVLEDISKFAFVDTEACVKSIVDRQQVDLSFCQTVHKKMSGELKAWLGIHPSPKVTLPPGVQASKLLQCTSECDPFDFWSSDVIAEKSCLRKAAMRVLSAKPSSCAVERVWSHFRDVFSPKRRAMLSSTLRRLVFVKLNMHLVPHDSLSETDMNSLVEIDESWVQSIVEATEQYDREIEIQNVAEQARGIECTGVDLLLEGVVDASEEVDGLELEDDEAALLDF